MDQGISGAHLRAVPRPVCYICRKPATERLYNGYNAPLWYYCGRHAKRALREFKERA